MAGYLAQKQLWHGETTVVLTDSLGRAEAQIIPGFGNNLIRLDISGYPVIFGPPNMEALRSAPTRYGNPLLFPPNRVKNATFDFNGHTYHLPANLPPHHLHGELCRRPWEITALGADDENGAFITALFEFSAHPDILAYYPFLLQYTLTYRLKEGKLSMEGRILNSGGEVAPLALGLHPYFTYLCQEGEEDAIELVLPVKNEWPVDMECFIAGPPANTTLSSSPLRVAELEAGGLYRMVTLQEGTNRSEIIDHHSNTRVVVETDENLPYMAIFRAPDRAVSLEPYTCVTDPFNLPWEAGAQKLEAGKYFNFNCAFWLETLA